MQMETMGVDYSVGDEVWVVYYNSPKLFKTTVTKRQVVLTTIGLDSDLEVTYWAEDRILPSEGIFPTQEAAERALIRRALAEGESSKY